MKSQGKILILGSKGALGGQLLKVFAGMATAWDRENIDVTEFKDLKFKIEKLNPSAIINCVAYNDVDGAEIKKEAAFKLNSEVPGFLASLCKKLDIPFMHFSTNYVFDGKKGEYGEGDLPNPLSVYGKSKYAGELEIIKSQGRFYIIRTSVLFGPSGQSLSSKKSFVDLMLELSLKNASIKAVNDEVNSICYATDLANEVKNMLEAEAPFGIYHIANSGWASWYEFAQEIFKVIGKKIEIVAVNSSSFKRAAQRPKKAVLLNTKLPQLRSWQEALKEYLATRNS